MSLNKPNIILIKLLSSLWPDLVSKLFLSRLWLFGNCPCLVPTRGLIVGLMVMIITGLIFPSSAAQHSCRNAPIVVIWYQHRKRKWVCASERTTVKWCQGRACTGLCAALFHAFTVRFRAFNWCGVCTVYSQGGEVRKLGAVLCCTVTLKWILLQNFSRDLFLFIIAVSVYYMWCTLALNETMYWSVVTRKHQLSWAPDGHQHLVSAPTLSAHGESQRGIDCFVERVHRGTDRWSKVIFSLILNASFVIDQWTNSDLNC